MDWLETMNAIIDSGGAELILGAVGLPVAAAGVAVYRKVRATQKTIKEFH